MQNVYDHCYGSGEKVAIFVCNFDSNVLRLPHPVVHFIISHLQNVFLQ